MNDFYKYHIEKGVIFMQLLKLLIRYIEENDVDYAFIARELELEEQELKRMLYWDEDLLLSELDDIMSAIGITYNELSDDFASAPLEATFETSVNKLMENLSQEERNLLEQLIEAVEADSNSIANIQVSKTYIN